VSAAAPVPVIILGGGGHARVLADALQLAGRRVLGFTAPQRQPELAPGIGWLGDDTAIEAHDPASVALVNGLGSTRAIEQRRRIYERLTGRSYRFAAVQHPSAVVSTLGTELGRGSQLLAGSLISPGVRLGDNVLINSRVAVEHDCRVGDHSHLATGAVLCGGCEVGPTVHVGAGATVIQGIRIGQGAVIGAGSVVTKDVEPSTLVAGVPAQKKASTV